MVSRSSLTQVLAVASLLPATLAAAQGHHRGTRVSPFETIEDTGSRGVVTLACDLERDSQSYLRLAALHGSDEPCELDLRIPGGRDVTLELRPVSCMPAGARGLVMEESGEERRVEPGAMCFSGTLNGGGEGGQVFIGFAPGQVHGYVSEAGELYFLSSAGSPRGRATLAHASQTGTLAEEFCSVNAPGEPSHVEALTKSGPILRVADVAVEVDESLSRRLGSGDACLDYVTILMTASGEIFRRDVGLVLRIPDGYLRVWKRPPPWGRTTTESVRHWYRNPAHPEFARPRAMVHSLGGGSVSKGYAAGVGGVCDEDYGGYCHSTCVGGFPYPIRHTDAGNQDLYTVSHEFGHVFGCPHSFLFDPPVECNDGSGPDNGTLMTYCGVMDMAHLGMRFHLREQQRLRTVIEQRPCIKTSSLLPGDYDGNGVRSRSDLAAAFAVHEQGFRSLGAEETFDLDRDGDFDSVDLAILTQIVSGAAPARATVRNGSDCNPRCLESLTNPVLGSTWLARVTAEPDGRPTALIVSDQAIPRLRTPFGELFVRPSPLGGRLFSTALVPVEHGEAFHAIPLPLDLSLSQRSLFVQAAVLGGPETPELCNALDLFLSPFE